MYTFKNMYIHFQPPKLTPRRFPSHLLLDFLSSFTFPGTPYRIFLPYLPRFPCHFYLVVIEQNQLTYSIESFFFIDILKSCVSRL